MILSVFLWYNGNLVNVYYLKKISSLPSPVYPVTCDAHHRLVQQYHFTFLIVRLY
jgi:hypothetical protein